MLHLYLLILPCLLVAFALGLLMGYFLWFRTSLNTDTTKILSGDLGALKKKLQERDKQLTSIGATHAKQLEALNNDLVSAKTERDRLRAVGEGFRELREIYQGHVVTRTDRVYGGRVANLESQIAVGIGVLAFVGGSS